METIDVLENNRLLVQVRELQPVSENPSRRFLRLRIDSNE